MKRRTRARGWLRAALLRGLLLVIALVFCEAPVGFAPAQAAPAVTMASAGEAVLTKKKKRKKKKKKRRKKKKKKRKKKKKKKADTSSPTPAGTRVAVLPFEEEGGGLAMASQVLLGVTSVEHANSNEVQGALDSVDPWSEASVRAALGANQATALVRGIGRKPSGYCEVRVYAYSTDGLVHFSEIYTTAPGDVDCLALAPQISDDLDRSLPNLKDLSVVGGPESWTATSASPGLPPPSPGTTGSSVSASNSGGEVEKKVEKKDESASPMVSLGVALDTLYWSYDLESSALVNTVYWHPLEPYLGAAAMASLWPVEYVGVDLRLDFGMHSYINIGEIDQERIDITALAIDAAVKGRYLADFGLGVGAHLGYRYVGTFVSEQTPITVAPSVGSHLLSPGLDLYVTALQPWLSVHLAGDVVPFGVYGETPDSPGAADSASLWGWHLEGSARSTFFMGIFAELSFFYENYYATYTGEGDRQNRAGTLVSDGRITNGMRGLALGVGWSY